MKAICLYLKDVEESKQLALRCVATCKQFDLDVKLFEGHTPSMAKQWIEKNNLHIFDPGPKLYKIKMQKPGVQGCLASHYHGWKHCVEINEPLIILEHDAVMVAGHVNQPFDEVLQLDEHRYKDDPEMELDVIDNTYERKGVKMMNGAHSYIVKPKAAQKLIDAIHNHGMAPADWHISERYVKIKTVRPRVFKVENKNSLTNDRDFFI